MTDGASIPPGKVVLAGGTASHRDNSAKGHGVGFLQRQTLKMSKILVAICLM